MMTSLPLVGTFSVVRDSLKILSFILRGASLNLISDELGSIHCAFHEPDKNVKRITIVNKLQIIKCKLITEGLFIKSLKSLSFNSVLSIAYTPDFPNL